MPERPRSRFTREKTWAALYNQHVNACYAIIPHSGTHNSLDVLKCATQEETRAAMRELARHDKRFEKFYSLKLPDTEAPTIQLDKQTPIVVRDRIRHAFVLAKSSDYYHYHLFDFSDFRLLIVGQHDSYVQMTVWETSTNKIYKPAETAIALDSPEFLKARSTQFGHNIFLGALICGNTTAVAIRDNKHLIPASTRCRIISEVQSIQTKRYRGRPLTFWDIAAIEKHKELTREGIQRSREQKRLTSI
jgi:hypothetical protein